MRLIVAAIVLAATTAVSSTVATTPAAAAPSDIVSTAVVLTDPSGLVVDDASNRIVVTGDDQLILLAADSLAVVAVLDGLVGVRDPQVLHDSVYVAVPGDPEVMDDERVVEISLVDGSIREDWFIPKPGLRSVAPTDETIMVLWGVANWEAGLLWIDRPHDTADDVDLINGTLNADSSVRASPSRPGEFYVDAPGSPHNVGRYLLDGSQAELQTQTPHGDHAPSEATFAVSPDGQSIWMVDATYLNRPREVDAVTMQTRAIDYDATGRQTRSIAVSEDGQRFATLSVANPYLAEVSIYQVGVAAKQNSYKLVGEPVALDVLDGRVAVLTDNGDVSVVTVAGLDYAPTTYPLYVELESFGKAPIDPISTTITCGDEVFSTFQVWGEVKEVLIPATHSTCAIDNPPQQGKIGDYFTTFRRDGSIAANYLQAHQHGFDPAELAWIVTGHTFPSPFDDVGLFFTQHYADIHGRGYTEADANWFRLRVTAGRTTAQVLVEMIEGQGGYDRSYEPVARLYEAFFLRRPDAEGIAYWVDLNQQGLTLPEIAGYFADSEEFRLRYGSLSTAEYLQLVYRNVLVREPDAGGLQYWTNLMDSGQLDKGGTMTWFSEGAEFGGRVNEELFVDYAVATFLRRSATAQELSSLQPVLRSDGRAAVVAEILQSTDYVERFVNWTG